VSGGKICDGASQRESIEAFAFVVAADFSGWSNV